MTLMYDTLRSWSRRRWLSALAGTALGIVVVAVPTDLVDTPFFGREVPPTWWSWPALVASAVLGGLLVGSYVRQPGPTERTTDPGPPDEDRPSRICGGAGGLLTFFAVGCPVCNKLVLLALGASGAMTYFEPVQPVLSLLALVLLAWALTRRLRNESACRVPVSRTPGTDRRPPRLDGEETAWTPPNGTAATGRPGCGPSNRTSSPRN